MTPMNYSSAIFLVNKDVRAVSISYEVDAEGKGIRPFTTFKTFDHDLKPGDFVVIPTDTRHKMTVVRIEEVDLDVDPSSGVQLDFLVQTVDPRPYKQLLAQEAEGIAKIKSAEKAAARRELTEKLLADNPDIQALGALNPGGTPALAAPPEPA